MTDQLKARSGILAILTMRLERLQASFQGSCMAQEDRLRTSLRALSAETSRNVQERAQERAQVDQIQPKNEKIGSTAEEIMVITGRVARTRPQSQKQEILPTKERHALVPPVR